MFKSNQGNGEGSSTCDPQNKELRVGDGNVVPHLVDDAGRVPDNQGEIQEDANPHRNLKKVSLLIFHRRRRVASGGRCSSRWPSTSTIVAVPTAVTEHLS